MMVSNGFMRTASGGSLRAFVGACSCASSAGGDCFLGTLTEMGGFLTAVAATGARLIRVPIALTGGRSCSFVSAGFKSGSAAGIGEGSRGGTGEGSRAGSDGSRKPRGSSVSGGCDCSDSFGADSLGAGGELRLVDFSDGWSSATCSGEGLYTGGGTRRGLCSSWAGFLGDLGSVLLIGLYLGIGRSSFLAVLLGFGGESEAGSDAATGW
jgi:hypothetical protein